MNGWKKAHRNQEASIEQYWNDISGFNRKVKKKKKKILYITSREEITKIQIK